MLRKNEFSGLSFYDQRTIWWDDNSKSVAMIDQTLLPLEVKFVQSRNVSDLIEAIKTMKVRGAPAIGVAGAMGVALSVVSSGAQTKAELLTHVRKDAEQIRSARPTAVNLAWGVDASLKFLEDALPEDFGKEEAENVIVGFVKELAESDVRVNKKLSNLGAKLFRNEDSVLTHCN